MKRILTSTAGQLALVVGFAVFGGISFWYWGAPSGDHVQRVVEAHRAREFEEKVEPELSPASQHAMAYIDAAISCDCEGIVSRTEWMQARLLALSESGASPEALAADRKKLCDNFCERKEAGFRVLDEGVDDPYLFFPGVEYRFVGEDSGREDLEVPVTTRAWVSLRFPSPTRSLKDPDGRSISGITVGLNLTTDGLIAKAGVLGNADINWDSVRYSW